MFFVRHSVLALRVLKWVLLASLAVFALATAFGFAHEREKALLAAHADAHVAVQSSLTAISNSLWQYDIASLNALLSGMVASRVVVRAEVLVSDKVLADISQSGFTGTVDRVWTVPVLAQDGKTVIGTLRISESYAQAHAQVADTLKLLVITDLVKIVGLALVLFVIVYRKITRHLRQLARDVAHLGHTEHAPPLSMARKSSATYRDEIDILVDAINRFVAERNQEMQRRSAAEDERRVAEQALAQLVSESEERYRTLIEWSPSAIGVHSAGILLYANAAAITMFGADSSQDLTGTRVYDRVHPDFREAVMKRVSDYIDHGEPAPLAKAKFLKMDGCVIDVEIQGTPIVFDGKQSTLFAVHDITQSTRAADELRIAATAFESQQGMAITDAQRVILRVNQAFTTITGYSAEEAVGQTPRILSSGRHDSAFYAAMTQTLQTEGAWSGEIWNRRKSGEVYPEWLTISAVNDSAGVTTHFVAIFSDVSDRVSAQAQIDTLAFYDPLTQLPNRRLLLDRLDQALHAGTRHSRKSALLFVDLDNFKTLNDTLGHHQGDLLLAQVAQRLRGCIRDGDTVARLGSDEFVVMLEDLSDNAQEAATQAETVGEKVLVALAQDYPLDGGSYHSTTSIGLTLFGDAQQESSEEPLKRGELAMFQAKAAGRNTLRFFDVQMQAQVSAHAALEADLRDAVHKQQFLLHYQPQVVGAGRITGVEALLRWQHPRRGMVSPAEFIPLAEKTGLILPLGQWVLDTACIQLAAWAHQPRMAHLTMAVNVSARQFLQTDFVDRVLATLAFTQATPRLLKLELTESMLVDEVEAVIAKMGALKARGVSFSLDDFGTGYSSLSYLKRLPLDQLKIDQGFIRNIVTDPNDAAIARMVVALAESMGLTVIAEGVELQAQADFLAHLGCHVYQGYLFSKPLALEALEAFASGGADPH
jgi:diguanylate cyclase (GGDEF)-like protein/PAS domain S-box-containing protein